MIRSVHALSMTIGFLLVLHFGVMAVDPVGMHVGADETVATLPAHSSHDGADPTGHAAHIAYGNMMSAETCIDAEGVASQSRVPLEPVAFPAGLLSPLGEAIPAESFLRSGWSPPVLDGRDLRVFLQVFLN
jgi:hypothetical protein